MAAAGFRTTTEGILSIMPGIHYHTICRTVGKECLDDAIAARSASAVTHKRTQEEIEEAVIRNILYRPTSMADITKHQEEIDNLSYDSFKELVDTLFYDHQTLPGISPGLLELVKRRMEKSGDNPMRYQDMYRITAYMTKPQPVDTAAVNDELNAFVRSLKVAGRRRTRRRRAKTTRKRRTKF
jgi:hypothetical protein